MHNPHEGCARKNKNILWSFQQFKREKLPVLAEPTTNRLLSFSIHFDRHGHKWKVSSKFIGEVVNAYVEFWKQNL